MAKDGVWAATAASNTTTPSTTTTAPSSTTTLLTPCGNLTPFVCNAGTCPGTTICPSDLSGTCGCM